MPYFRVTAISLQIRTLHMPDRTSVAYDYPAFIYQRYGGIPRIYAELAQRIQNTAGWSAEIIAPYHMNEIIAGLEPPIMRGKISQRLPRSKTILNFINRQAQRKWLRNGPFDIVHETYFSLKPAIPSHHAKRRVVTVYDMIYELFIGSPDKPHKVSIAKAAACQRADHIICISKSTQRDLVELLDIPIEKTSVTYLASGTLPPPNPENPVGRPYFLFVGGRGGYKNFQLILEALAIQPQLLNELALVAFGGDPFDEDELAQLLALNLPLENIIQIGGDDQALATLYAHAEAFIYPSKYEGFGLPILEGMGAGVPVICGSQGSCPEVAGEAAAIIDPNNAEELASILCKVSSDSNYREKLIQSGFRRYQEFSWDKCAADTMAVYEKVLAN